VYETIFILVCMDAFPGNGKMIADGLTCIIHKKG